MKKKIISLCLVLALALTAIGGATLAYFTDTDTATNKFTATQKGIKIQIIEQQRNEDGSKLVDFVQSQTLYPIVGSAQGPKDEWGMTTAENYVDKIITVKNLEENAYVRLYIAIPAALVSDGSASEDVVHWNWGNKTTLTGDYAQAGEAFENQKNATDYTANMGALVTLPGTTKINGVDHVVYYQTYNKELAKNDVTGSAFMAGLYLDKGVTVDYDENTQTTTYYREGAKVDYDLSNLEIPVFAVGVQSAGFADVKDATGKVTTTAADVAIEAAFGANYNPWATTAAE